MNHYTLSKTNGSKMEKRVSEAMGIDMVNKKWDGEKDGQKYEIKSCQEFVKEKRGRRRGRFIFKEEDFEDVDVIFIFLVQDGEGAVNGRKLSVREFLNWHLKVRALNWKKLFSIGVGEKIKL